MGRPRVLLVTGPGGSGKTTLARAAAERWGWVALSEDDYWVENGWGSGRRTAEQEAVVQAQVVRDVRAATAAGRDVVLELILYRLPPNPLTAYQDGLAEDGVTVATIALKPPVEELLRRMQERGRPRDAADVEHRRPDAEWQVAVLEAGAVDPDRVIDPTGLTVDETLDRCAALVGR